MANLLELLRKKLTYLKVEKHNGCWELRIPRKKDGTTHIKVDGGKMIKAHRASAAIYNGIDLDDPTVIVSQKCKNKACWNPNHLEILR